MKDFRLAGAHALALSRCENDRRQIAHPMTRSPSRNSRATLDPGLDPEIVTAEAAPWTIGRANA
jgi:hypothetical protein